MIIVIIIIFDSSKAGILEKNRFNAASPLCNCGTANEDNKHFLLQCPLFDNFCVNLHGELSECLNLDVPNLDGNLFCSLLLYGSAEFPLIINRMILEATIKYIKSSKPFDHVNYEN